MAKYFAFVYKNNCAACGACVSACPKKAISVYKGCFAVVDAGTCVGCGRCEKVCPTGCITVKEREKYEE